MQLFFQYLCHVIAACYSVIDDTVCPGIYQAVLTVTGFTEAHSGTYTVTVMNRASAGSITHSFQRAQEG